MILPTFLFLTFYSSSVFSNAETELARVKVRSEEERHAMERKVHLMVEVSAHLSLANTIYTYISLVNLFTRRQRGDSMRPRAWGTRCRYSSTVHMYSDSTVNRLRTGRQGRREGSQGEADGLPQQLRGGRQQELANLERDDNSVTQWWVARHCQELLGDRETVSGRGGKIKIIVNQSQIAIYFQYFQLKFVPWPSISG